MPPRDTRILLLDDDRSRIEAFRRWIERLSLAATAVETAEECIEQLKSGVWDLVLLDHDLSGETYVDSTRSDTGMEVVRWLQSVSEVRHGAFIVHSMNEVAAAAMYFDLQELGCSVEQVPFGSREFYSRISRILGVNPPKVRAERKSLSARFRAYLESIKSGR